MAITPTGLMNFADRLQWESLNQRLQRSHVLAANIANAETPGFRALGYDFEEQLQDLAGSNEPLAMKVNSTMHKRNAFTQADGTIQPDVFVRPTESVGNDGNTVDLEKEMSALSENAILYKTALQLINKKMAALKYAIGER